jgi:cell division protein FtsI (penicillin-binding protein 3)
LPKVVPIGLTARPTGTGRNSSGYHCPRTVLTVALFAFAFVVLGARLVALGFDKSDLASANNSGQLSTALDRPEITDRAGRILATDILTGSLYANPQKIIDIDDTVERLVAVLPDLDATTLRHRLSADGQFEWVARKLTPRQQARIHELGIPGLHFTPEPQRVYPAGAEAAHVLGHVDVDNKALAGIETWIDRAPRIVKPGSDMSAQPAPVRLAMDLSVQHALRTELADARERYKAKAAAGLVLDIHSGEVVALASLPDYDPNRRGQALEAERYNRLTSGVFEMGSVFKIFTTAAALDLGVTSLTDGYDASEPLRAGVFTISDFHPKSRWLTVPEIFIYSSNIGSARMALDIGVERHKAFLAKLGLLAPLDTEIGRTAAPILPRSWRRINTMTIAYGHGISVTPLQLAAAAATLINGGYRIEPTFLRRSREEARVRAEQVIDARTSAAMRYLFRLNVESGTGGHADATGYRVGGKTGTAEKVVDGQYSTHSLLTSFVGAFPMDAPRYLTLVMLDEPQGTEETSGSATAGVNAAAVTGRLVERIGPMLDVPPKLENQRRFDEAVSASY